MVFRHFLSKQRIGRPDRTKNRSRPAMISTGSRHLEKLVSTEPAGLDSRLLPATPPHKQNHKKGSGEKSRRVRTVCQPGSQKDVWLGKLRAALCGRNRSPKSVYIDRLLLCTPQIRRELKHGQFENAVPGMMLVGCGVQQYPAEVPALPLLKGNSNLPPALRTTLCSLAIPRPFLSSALLLSKERTG